MAWEEPTAKGISDFSKSFAADPRETKYSDSKAWKEWDDYSDREWEKKYQDRPDSSWTKSNSPEDYAAWLNDKDIRHGDYLGSWDYNNPEKLGANGQKLPPGAISWTPNGDPYYGDGLKGWANGFKNRILYPYAEEPTEIIARSAERMGLTDVKSSDGYVNIAATIDNAWRSMTSQGDTPVGVASRGLAQTANAIISGFGEVAKKAKQVLGTADFMTRWAFDRDKALEFNGIKQMWDAKSFTRANSVTVQTPTDFGEALDVAWNSSRVLYSGVWDASIRANYIRRYMDGENPYMLTMEMENPWAEGIGELVLDPLNVVGVIAKAWRHGKDIERVAKLMTHIDEPLEVALKTMDNLDDVASANKIQEIADIIMRNGDATKDGLASYAKQYGLRALSAEGKAQEKGLIVGNVIGAIVANQNPEQAMEMIKTLAQLYSGDKKLAELGVVALRHMDNPRILLSEAGRMTGVFIKEALTDAATGKANPKAFLSALAKASAGGTDELVDFAFKTIAKADTMFPTVNEMEKAYKAVNAGGKGAKSARTIALAEQYKQLPAYVKQVNKWNNAGSKVKNPVNNLLSGIYMGYNPGFAVRNLIQNTVIGFIDEGIGNPFFSKDNAIKELTEFFGDTPAVQEMIKGFGATTGMGAAEKTVGFASKWSDEFEQRGSVFVAMKAMKRTWGRMLKEGALIPETTMLARAGMPPEQIGMLTSLMTQYNGDVRQAIDTFKDILKGGRQDYWKAGQWMDKKTFDVLQDLNKQHEVWNAIKESDNVPDLVKKLTQIRDDLLKYGAKASKKAVAGVPESDGVAVDQLKDLVDMFDMGEIPAEVRQTAARLFSNHINSNIRLRMSTQRVWDQAGRELAGSNLKVRNAKKRIDAAENAFNLIYRKEIMPIQSIGQGLKTAPNIATAKGYVRDAIEYLPDAMKADVLQGLDEIPDIADRLLEVKRYFFNAVYYPHYNGAVLSRNEQLTHAAEVVMEIATDGWKNSEKLTPAMVELLENKARAQQFNKLAANFKQWDGRVVLDLHDGRIGDATQKLLNMFGVTGQAGAKVEGQMGIFTEPKGWRSIQNILRGLTGKEYASIKDIKTLDDFNAIHEALYSKILTAADKALQNRVRKWKPELTGKVAELTASTIKNTIEEMWGKVGQHIDDALTQADEPELVTKLWDNVSKNLGSDQDGLNAVEDARNALRQWLEQRGATKTDLRKFDRVMKPLIEETDTAIGTAVHVTGDTGIVNMSKQSLSDLLARYVAKTPEETKKILDSAMGIEFELYPDELLDVIKGLDKEDLGKVMQGIDPGKLDGGLVDGTMPNWGQAIDAQKHHIKGFFDNMIEQVTQSGNKFYPEMAVNGEIDNAMSQWSKIAMNRNIEAKAITAQVTKQLRDFTMLNYGQKTYGQLAMAYVMPYSFWYSQSYVNWLKRLVTDPQVVAGYSKFKDTMAKVHAGAPDWLRYSLNTNELLGIDSDHPFYFNIEASLNPLNGLVGVDFNDQRRRVTWYSQLVDDLGKSGASVWTPISWVTALALKMNDEEDAAARFAGRLFPQSAAIKSLLSVVGARIEIGGGVNELDPGVHLWSGGVDPYERSRVARKLYWMVEQGMISEAQAIDAASGQNQELWNDAVIEASRSRFWSNMGSSIAGVGFKGRSPDDLQIDYFNQAHMQLINMRHNLSPEEYKMKMQALRDAYPAMDALLIARKSGYERDSALGWNVLNRLPPGQKDDLMGLVGLRREMQSEWYENKGDIKAMIKAGIWTEKEYTKFMDGMLSLSVLFDIPDDATKFTWDSVSRSYSAINKGLVEAFGEDIFDVQAGYFAIPDSDPEGRDAYLEAYPQLREAWAMKDQLIFNKVELRPYYHNMEKIERYYEGLMYADLDSKAPTWREDMEEYYRIKDADGTKAARAFWNKTPSLNTYSSTRDYWHDYIAKQIVNIAGYIKDPIAPTLREVEAPTPEQEDVMDYIAGYRQDVNPAFTWDANQWADKMGATLTRRIHDVVVRGMKESYTVRQQVEKIADEIGEPDYIVWELLDQAFNNTSGRGADIR